MSANRKSSQAAIDRATSWNLSHVERRRAIALKSYLKLRPPLKSVLTVHERFDRLYIPVPESGCWLWLGAVNKNGYGKIKYERRHWTAHRLAWQLFKGDIPIDICVLHRCDVPICVNPDHLFLGTNQDNVDDCVSKDRHARGERNGEAVISVRDVLAIRSMNGIMNQQSIAEKFGISRGHISKILSHKNWKETT